MRALLVQGSMHSAAREQCFLPLGNTCTRRQAHSGQAHSGRQPFDLCEPVDDHGRIGLAKCRTLDAGTAAFES